MLCFCGPQLTWGSGGMRGQTSWQRKQCRGELLKVKRQDYHVQKGKGLWNYGKGREERAGQKVALMQQFGCQLPLIHKQKKKPRGGLQPKSEEEEEKQVGERGQESVFTHILHCFVTFFHLSNNAAEHGVSVFIL